MQTLEPVITNCDCSSLESVQMERFSVKHATARVRERQAELYYNPSLSTHQQVPKARHY
jgi:hypothetical protein